MSMIEDRFQVLADKESIREVIQRQCRGVDRGDMTLVREAYLPDATEDHHGEVISGNDALAERLVATMQATMASTSIHITSQTIAVHGDTAGAESYYLGIHRARVDGAERRLITSGRYVDELQRRDGEWGIAHRTTMVDMCRVTSLDDEIATGGPQGRRDRDDPSYRVLDQGRG